MFAQTHGIAHPHLNTGILHAEVALGGDINRIQLDGEDLLVVVNDGDFNTSVVRVGAGGVQVLDARTGFVHADIMLLGDNLYVADRTVGDAGLRVLGRGGRGHGAA